MDMRKINVRLKKDNESFVLYGADKEALIPYFLDGWKINALL